LYRDLRVLGRACNFQCSGLCFALFYETSHRITTPSHSAQGEMALAQKIMDRLLELSTALHSCDPDQQRASLMGSAGLGIGIGPGGECLVWACMLAV